LLLVYLTFVLCFAGRRRDTGVRTPLLHRTTVYFIFTVLQNFLVMNGVLYKGQKSEYYLSLSLWQRNVCSQKNVYLFEKNKQAKVFVSNVCVYITQKPLRSMGSELCHQGPKPTPQHPAISEEETHISQSSFLLVNNIHLLLIACPIIFWTLVHCRLFQPIQPLHLHRYTHINGCTAHILPFHHALAAPLVVLFPPSHAPSRFQWKKFLLMLRWNNKEKGWTNRKVLNWTFRALRQLWLTVSVYWPLINSCIRTAVIHGLPIDARLRCDVWVCFAGMGKCEWESRAGMHAKGFQLFFPVLKGAEQGVGPHWNTSSSASKVSLFHCDPQDLLN
jgi:hypothetical protein